MRGNKGKREKNKNKIKKTHAQEKKNATDVSKSNNSISSQGQAGGWAAQGWRGACAVPALPCGCGVLRGLPGPPPCSPPGSSTAGPAGVPDGLGLQGVGGPGELGTVGLTRGVLTVPPPQSSWDALKHLGSPWGLGGVVLAPALPYGTWKMLRWPHDPPPCHGSRDLGVPIYKWGATMRAAQVS